MHLQKNIKFQPLNTFLYKFLPTPRFRGRRKQLHVFMEEGLKIINFINLLRCHGIKNIDLDHVWWYEIVSKC